MKTAQPQLAAHPGPASGRPTHGMPGPAELATLRAWHEGLPARDAVVRYLGDKKASGQSSRAMIGKIRRRLHALARRLHRDDLASLFARSASTRTQYAKAVAHAIDVLPSLAVPQPLIGDDVALWLPRRTASALTSHGLKTLAALTVNIPRRRRWWAAIPGLGAIGARQVEAFFAAHPSLTERARALVRDVALQDLVPWERLVLPSELDGSRGTFRAPQSSCTLSAKNDYEAVQAWLALHEAPATLRAYRKEAERLILWAILERGRALSSLTNEDAVAYRAFLRKPAPRLRWIGPPRPRESSEWRPFATALSPRSAAYALSVLGALYRWLIQQRYVLANPFAGVKVRGGTPAGDLSPNRAFSESEWSMIQSVAQGLEWSFGWSEPAAQRLRFIVDFSYATGLRASELVSATLGMISTDPRGNRWLNVVGKGQKSGKVVLPPRACACLDRYLVQRGLPTTQTRWNPSTPLVGSLDIETTGISSSRLWTVVKRFFDVTARVVEERNPTVAEKLRSGSPHWMRHTHATHALARGAELPAVRDNLRHASLSTTSLYLHSNEDARAREFGTAFPAS